MTKKRAQKLNELLDDLDPEERDGAGAELVEMLLRRGPQIEIQDPNTWPTRRRRAKKSHRRQNVKRARA